MFALLISYHEINLHSKFISEEEKDGSAAFLDTKKIMNPDMIVHSKALFKDKGAHTDPLPPPLPLQFSGQEQTVSFQPKNKMQLNTMITRISL